MTTFVETPITTNEAQLKEEALEKLKEQLENKGVVGWEPSEGDLEIILLGIIASFGLNAAVVASTVLEAVFQQFGLQFLKLQFNEGTAAKGTVKLKLKAEGAIKRTIPAGTQIEAGGVGFYTEAETKIETTEETEKGKIAVVALERGTEGNKISGVAQQINPISFVEEVTFEGETSGGKEEETSDEYRVRLVSVIALQAARPITANNFAAFVLQIPSAEIGGLEVRRATSIDGYNPETEEHEAKTTSGSAVLKEVTASSTWKEHGITVGTEIVGAGIPKGTYVESYTSIEETAKELKMSQKATATESKKAYKFVGSYEQERYTTTFITNSIGESFIKSQMEKVEKVVAEYREINFKTPIRAPEYNKIYVKVKVHPLPGFENASVKTSVEESIKALLSKEKWGNPEARTTGSSQWLNWKPVYESGVLLPAKSKLYAIVRYNVVLEIIGATPGVAYVYAGGEGLEIGLESGAKGTSDLAMIGPAPLPEPEIESITVL